MTSPLPLTRRQFLQHSAVTTAVVAAPLILPSGLRGQNAPSKKITVGIIGCGNIADGHYGPLLGSPETIRVLAVCDVRRSRRDPARERVDAHYATRLGRESARTERLELTGGGSFRARCGS